MNRNLLNFTGVLIVMVFINFATGATNLNKQRFATQLGSDVSGKVQNSADRGERATPVLQPVVAETSLPLTTRGPVPPRPPPGSIPNLPPIAETPRPTYLLTTSQKPTPGINYPPTNPVIAAAPAIEPETSTDAL
ncbi:hypothetical protein DAPPUDRAFT_325047 [Daphnia pulex]|uniref:Uncharacterized protein n=1 Tax=Daphnia pulex TaxID=6669 RepID=E9H3J7_DAPPU|nr:hypothetical protein DAPPUDRAFT_325047 [Daphnia pulex]|eukprot:EFX73690.1 hypothetical protein DAPPUDRAFT_325047 [Daphnia pulex]